MKKALLFLALLSCLFTASRSNGQTIFSEHDLITFEADDSLWQKICYIDTTHYHHNFWQVGKPHKSPFDTGVISNVMITDTANLCGQNDTSVFIITCPGFLPVPYLPWLAFISFQYQLSIDTNSFAILEFSSDTGKTWVNLKDSIPKGIRAYDKITNTNGWASTSVLFDVSYVRRRDSLMLRFKLITGNDTPGSLGWMIDNMHIMYDAEKVEQVQNDRSVSLFPNPVINELVITSADVITSVCVTDMVGRSYSAHEYNTKEIHINTEGFPSGVYFLKVNNSIIKKFIKR